MKFYKKITFIGLIFLIFQTNLLADSPYYLDFKYIEKSLNNCLKINFSYYDALESRSCFNINSKENIEFINNKNNASKDIKEKLKNIISL